MTTPQEAANAAHRAIQNMIGAERLPLERQQEIVTEAHYAIGTLEALALMKPAIDYTQDPQSVRPVAGDMTTHELNEPIEAEVQAFTQAWGAEREKIGRGIAPKGTKTRAGLRAAYAARKDRLAAAHAESVERSKYVHQERTRRIKGFQDILQQYVKPKGQQHLRDLASLTEEMIKDVETLQGSNDTLRRTITGLQADLAAQTSPVEHNQGQRHDPHGGHVPFRTVKGSMVRTALTAARTAISQSDPASKRAEGLRTNALSLLAVTAMEEDTAATLRTIVNEMAALATAEQDITDDDIYAERQNQISLGYSARHDDQHGIRHLLLQALRYGKQRKSVESLALIRAALESMARQGKDL